MKMFGTPIGSLVAPVARRAASIAKARVEVEGCADEPHSSVDESNGCGTGLSLSARSEVVARAVPIAAHSKTLSGRTFGAARPDSFDRPVGEVIEWN